MERKPSFSEIYFGEETELQINLLKRETELQVNLLRRGNRASGKTTKERKLSFR